MRTPMAVALHGVGVDQVPWPEDLEEIGRLGLGVDPVPDGRAGALGLGALPVGAETALLTVVGGTKTLLVDGLGEKSSRGVGESQVETSLGSGSSIVATCTLRSSSS